MTNDIASMPAYQARVVEEKKELDEKVHKLETFLGTDMFRALGIDDRLLLREQMTHMTRYSYVLAQRVQRFENAKTATVTRVTR